LEIGRSHRVTNQGITVGGGWKPIFVSLETAGWGRKYDSGRCHGEAAKPVLANVQGDVFACFHTLAA
jgi:hypothetical protein